MDVRSRAGEDRFILLKSHSGLSPRLHENCKASRADCKAAEDPAGNGWAYEAGFCCTDAADGQTTPFGQDVWSYVDSMGVTKIPGEETPSVIASAVGIWYRKQCIR